MLSGLDEISQLDHADAGPLSRVNFNDVHEETGLQFIYDNGASPRKLMTESTSGGGGWLDYDRDGWPDLFFAQGGDPTATSRDSQPVDELFRNVLGKRFAAVTRQALPGDTGFGHGMSVGDFDNDGFDDLYIANVGPDALYKNMGDGTFIDVTETAGIINPLWSSSAAWGDLDGDRDLDLYVCNYVDYDPLNPIACLDEEGNPATCHPDNVDPVPNVCFFNNGNGTFVDESDQRGLNAPGSKSLGVVIADFTGDGMPDVYVANDTTANHMFVNQGDGQFEENGVGLGCALSGLAHPQASMGVAFGDYDRNGWPDLYVTHFTTDSNTLYQNLGTVGFTDATRPTGLHQATLPFLAFGTVMADFDLNGWQDLFIANGHIDDWRERTGARWRMPAQLFYYDGRKWEDCGNAAGPYFQRELLGRAVATADYDRDGDLDLAVVHQNDPAGLLRNDSDRGHWLQLSFIGTSSNRRGVGVEVTVSQGDLTLVQQLAGGTSYCASHQPVLSFGLGESRQPCHLTVKWPSGRLQELHGIEVDQFIEISEGEAQ